MRIWLSLGSNLQRKESFRGAIKDLRRDFGELALSPVYEGEAIGTDGPAFYNMVVGVDSELPVEQVHLKLRGIEHAHGRRRGEDKFAPRTLDIDILTYGDHVIDFKGKELPKDEILKYAFVLRPLADVAGDEAHPQLGTRYADLWNDFDQGSQPLSQVELDF